MPPFLLSLLAMFAKPLGTAVNHAITIGAASVTAWAVSKGADVGVVTPIVAGFVVALSTTVNVLASTQSVNIGVINADQSNGIRVVSSAAADKANIPAAAVPNPG